jgi:bleomycin hydrolase
VYTVEGVKNICEKKSFSYMNVEIDVMKRAAVAFIWNNEPVWVSCDVTQHSLWASDCGIADTELYDHGLIFDANMCKLDKSQRLRYYELQSMHAMILTGYAEENGVVTASRAENSWSDRGGFQGYMTIMDNWFDQFVFDVAIGRKYLSAAELQIADGAADVLERWDIMGLLVGSMASKF